MRCAVCDRRPASTGLLCEECHDDLPSPAITPEQIITHGTRPTGAALIDLWGRPWPLDERTLVGRDGASNLTILESSISRHHAQLGRDAATDCWILRDLGSSNGTSVDDQPVTEPTRLVRGARIAFGSIGFYFLDRTGVLPSVTLDPAASATIRPTDRVTPLVTVAGAPEDVVEYVDPEITNVGIATMSIRLHEPSGGGGGILEVRGKKVQLTTTQFELCRLLADRMLAEAHQPDLVRGFMRSSELIGTLSWDSHDPADTHVKQLVRRTRRVLIKADIGDLIEARQRFGYRLRVIPKLA